MQSLKGIIKFVIKLLLYIPAAILLLIILQYITCPVYDFKHGKEFSGDKIYNPYKDIKSKDWRKANFQIQSRAWGGITSGSQNSNEMIFRTYKSLGYDIIATSDYQKINRYKENEPFYIPVYEHGYGIHKNHHVLVGAKSVLWRDYPIFQTLSNKQHILNLLRKDNELVYIAHPLLRNGYDVSDMKYLTNYDGIEVLNNYRFSIDHWDTALSNGNYVTILGDDDAHDIFNPDEIGHHCTFINSPTTNKNDIIAALKQGRSFGARIYRPLGESFEDKIKRISVLPVIKSVNLNNDTIFVSIDSVAKEIRFVGQNATVKKVIKNSNSATYKFKADDTYIRIEIEFPDHSAYYLNPVCRYSGEAPSHIPVPSVNIYKTWLLRILGFSTLIFIFVNIILFKRRKSRQKKQ